MPDGAWKIHLKSGQLEIEVTGANKEETLELFEKVVKNFRSPKEDMPMGKTRFPYQIEK